MNAFGSSPGRGVQRYSAMQRAQLLAAFERSGLSAAAFAREHHLNYTTFCSWRSSHARAKAPKVPAFVQVELPPVVAATELVIELGSPARLLVRSAAQIELAAQLIKAFSGQGA